MVPIPPVFLVYLIEFVSQGQVRGVREPAEVLLSRPHET
jgi:hypothetical protein